jgi:hypothetical protein
MIFFGFDLKTVLPTAGYAFSQINKKNLPMKKNPRGTFSP